METTTPFDLNQAIQRWREKLAQSPAFRSENIYELETHLRDLIARLQSQELSDEEAFIVATKRIGNASALEDEFVKFNQPAIWLDRALWVLIGAQLWSLASVLAYHAPILLNVSLANLNALFATYGFGRIPESVPGQLVYLVVLPLILIVGARIFSISQRWAGRKGWSPLNCALNRPRLLACVYIVLFVSPALINYGMQRLVLLFAWQPYNHQISAVSGLAKFVFMILPPVVFATIVLFIARRKLSLSQR